MSSMLTKSSIQGVRLDEAGAEPSHMLKLVARRRRVRGQTKNWWISGGPKGRVSHNSSVDGQLCKREDGFTCLYCFQSTPCAHSYSNGRATVAISFLQLVKLHSNVSFRMLHTNVTGRWLAGAEWLKTGTRSAHTELKKRSEACSSVTCC